MNNLSKEISDLIVYLSLRNKVYEELVAECSDYLKTGETPLQRIERDHQDILSLLEQLAKEKKAREKAEAALCKAEGALASIENIGDDERGFWKGLKNLGDRDPLLMWSHARDYFRKEEEE